MTDTTDIANLRERLRTTREYLRTKLRDLELDAVLIRGRTDEVREAIAALDDLIEDTPRRGRTRKITIINPPQPMHEPETEDSLAGGTYEPERDEEGELPEGRKRAAGIMAAREILKGDDAA